VEPGDELALSLAFQAGSLDAATAERALGHLEMLLAGMAAAGPDRRLADLPLLTASETAELLAAEGAGLGTAPAPPQTVVALGEPGIDLPELLFLSGVRLEAAPAGPAGVAAAAASSALLATPTQLQALFAAGWEGTDGLVLCRGEELARGLADRLLERAQEVWTLRTAPWPAAARVLPGVEPVSAGTPLGGARWVVLDGGGQLLPAGIPGGLAVVPPGGEARRTGERARLLPGGGVEPLGADRPVSPGAVTSGEVEALLRRHPRVLGAAVADRAAEGRWAWICPDPFRPPAAEELRASLREALPERELPSAIVFLPALPMAADGRLDRGSLPRPGPADLRRAHLPPRDSLELALARLWEELFDLAPVGVRDDFFELGGHSLLAVRLMAEVRARFGLDLPLAALFAQPTIERLAALLRQGGRDLPWSPLVSIQAGGTPPALPPLFLFHPAGGGVLGYAELARRLGPERPVYGLQARGQEAGQRPVRSLRRMASSYVEALRQVQPCGPYFLGGSSFGAYLAYEAACQLSAAGEEVGLVLLLDAAVPRDEEEPDPLEYLGVLVRETLPHLAAGLPRERDLDGQLAWVLNALRQEDLAVAGFELADLRRYFDVYWTNVEASLSWTPRLYNGPVVLLRARGNPETPPSILEDPTLGWGSVALGGVEVLDVPGTHFDLLDPPHVEELAARFRALLDHAAAGAAESFSSTSDRVPETIRP
jgi:thioesterase domain-containing protein